MKIYLDYGVFIDYLIGRGHSGSILRTTNRRGRTPQNLLTDAETCFAAIRANHIGITSTLTCYEAEEAMYRALSASARGIPNSTKLIIPSARAVITQTLVTIDLFQIKLVDLTPQIVNAQCTNVELQKRGIRAADSLHITTALAEGADILISTDDDLISLDAVFVGSNGGTLRCVDTDAAIPLL